MQRKFFYPDAVLHRVRRPRLVLLSQRPKGQMLRSQHINNDKHAAWRSRFTRSPSRVHNGSTRGALRDQSAGMSPDFTGRCRLPPTAPLPLPAGPPGEGAPAATRHWKMHSLQPLTICGLKYFINPGGVKPRRFGALTPSGYSFSPLHVVLTYTDCVYILAFPSHYFPRFYPEHGVCPTRAERHCRASCPGRP